MKRYFVISIDESDEGVQYYHIVHKDMVVLEYLRCGHQTNNWYNGVTIFESSSDECYYDPTSNGEYDEDGEYIEGDEEEAYSLGIDCFGDSHGMLHRLYEQIDELWISRIYKAVDAFNADIDAWVKGRRR